MAATTAAVLAFGLMTDANAANVQQEQLFSALRNVAFVCTTSLSGRPFYLSICGAFRLWWNTNFQMKDEGGGMQQYAGGWYLQTVIKDADPSTPVNSTTLLSFNPSDDLQAPSIGWQCPVPCMGESGATSAMTLVPMPLIDPMSCTQQSSSQSSQSAQSAAAQSTAASSELMYAGTDSPSAPSSSTQPAPAHQPGASSESAAWSTAKPSKRPRSPQSSQSATPYSAAAAADASGSPYVGLTEPPRSAFAKLTQAESDARIEAAEARLKAEVQRIKAEAGTAEGERHSRQHTEVLSEAQEAALKATEDAAQRSSSQSAQSQRFAPAQRSTAQSSQSASAHQSTAQSSHSAPARQSTAQSSLQSAPARQSAPAQRSTSQSSQPAAHGAAQDAAQRSSSQSTQSGGGGFFARNVPRVVPPPEGTTTSKGKGVFRPSQLQPKQPMMLTVLKPTPTTKSSQAAVVFPAVPAATPQKRKMGGDGGTSSSSQHESARVIVKPPQPPIMRPPPGPPPAELINKAAQPPGHAAPKVPQAHAAPKAAVKVQNPMKPKQPGHPGPAAAGPKQPGHPPPGQGAPKAAGLPIFPKADQQRGGWMTKCARLMDLVEASRFQEAQAYVRHLRENR